MTEPQNPALPPARPVNVIGTPPPPPTVCGVNPETGAPGFTRDPKGVTGTSRQVRNDSPIYTAGLQRPEDQSTQENYFRTYAHVQHDAEGNPGVDFTIYDASSKEIDYKSSENVGGCCGFPVQPSMEILQTYDADGLPASNRQITRENVWVPGPNGPELQSVNTVDETIYFVRSTVLGGVVIAELVPGSGGQLRKHRINVYGHGQRIATEVHSAIQFEHNNPVTGTSFDIGAHSNDRVPKELRELDPFSAYIPGADPQPSTDYLQLGAGRPFQESGNPFDIVEGCPLDQMPISCSFLDRLMRVGGVQTQYLGLFTHRTYYKPNESGRIIRTVPVIGDVIYHGIGIFEYWLPPEFRSEYKGGVLGFSF